MNNGSLYLPMVLGIPSEAFIGQCAWALMVYWVSWQFKTGRGLYWRLFAVIRRMKPMQAMASSLMSKGFTVAIFLLILMIVAIFQSPFIKAFNPFAYLLGVFSYLSMTTVGLIFFALIQQHQQLIGAGRLGDFIEKPTTYPLSPWWLGGLTVVVVAVHFSSLMPASAFGVAWPDVYAWGYAGVDVYQWQVLNEGDQAKAWINANVLAIAAALVCTAIGWSKHFVVAASLGIALLIYAIDMRFSLGLLPSANLWDALVDPCLAIYLLRKSGQATIRMIKSKTWLLMRR